MMIIWELILICKPQKMKEDDKIPVKKQEFIDAYTAWKNTPPPDFGGDIFSSD